MITHDYNGECPCVTKFHTKVFRVVENQGSNLLSDDWEWGKGLCNTLATSKIWYCFKTKAKENRSGACHCSRLRVFHPGSPTQPRHACADCCAHSSYCVQRHLSTSCYLSTQPPTWLSGDQCLFGMRYTSSPLALRWGGVATLQNDSLSRAPYGSGEDQNASEISSVLDCYFPILHPQSLVHLNLCLRLCF